MGPATRFEQVVAWQILGRDLHYLVAYDAVYAQLDEAARLLAGYIAGIENHR